MTSPIEFTAISRPVNSLFLLVLLLAVGVSALLDGALYLPLAFIGGAFLWWTYQKPEVWLFFAILFHAVFLQRTEGISAGEILFGLYFFGFLAFWFVSRILFRSANLVTEPAGAWLLVFLVISVLSLGVGLLNRAVLTLWFREILTTSVLFLFFPALDILKTDRGKKGVIAALFILSAGLALYNVTMYTSTALAAEFSGGLIGKRQPGSVHFFFSMVVLTSALLIHSVGSLRFRVLVVGVLALNGAALTATFTRGFWIGTMISIFVLFLLAEPRKKIAMMFGSAGVILVGAIVLLSFGGAVGEVVISSIFSRFLSSGEAFQDISFTNRIAESVAIIDAILRSPLLGSGYGTSFRYFNLIYGTTSETWYSHNGYLFLIFKVGLVGATAFLGFYAIIMWRGLRLALFSPHGSSRAFVHAAWAVLISMLVVTVTSNVFIEREALLLICLAAAFLTNVSRAHAENSLHLSSNQTAP